MTHITVSRRAADFLLQDATQRCIATARRATLLQILRNECYLTRAQLIARLVTGWAGIVLEQPLGRRRFIGICAW